MASQVGHGITGGHCTNWPCFGLNTFIPGERATEMEDFEPEVSAMCKGRGSNEDREPPGDHRLPGGVEGSSCNRASSSAFRASASFRARSVSSRVRSLRPAVESRNRISPRRRFGAPLGGKPGTVTVAMVLTGSPDRRTDHEAIVRILAPGRRTRYSTEYVPRYSEGRTHPDIASGSRSSHHSFTCIRRSVPIAAFGKESPTGRFQSRLPARRRRRAGSNQDHKGHYHKGG